MKHIDFFLTTRIEAVTEVATLDDDRVLDTIVWEGILVVYGDLCDTPPNIRDALLKAASLAAENGHQTTVEYVVEVIDEVSYTYNKYEGMKEVLQGGASHGHLNIVKFMVNHALEKKYTHVYGARNEPDALTHAILGQHNEIVEFLLQIVGEVSWNIAKPDDVAASRHDEPLAEKLYGIYPGTVRTGDLLVELARRGYDQALKYAYTSGHDNVESTNAAFMAAAKWGSIDVLKF
ncbi:hypothetical protein GN958_ATG12742 [Phytophthora infestans]|uniref:Ankyrin repeat protein n=1 Tax=Phytophthora infestans TaxID=4787 RepID=A0A8S9UC98_PHYIN|nr:hypothetical protein GN958_ATG12742 [Phytophthora infestans]